MVWLPVQILFSVWIWLQRYMQILLSSSRKIPCFFSLVVGKKTSPLRIVINDCVFGFMTDGLSKKSAGFGRYP
ncbi:MAG: hypothetical protein B6D37_13240 [Sphingobacteriales bacterium UTBCD1]|nr:MAG: hypothetical protein B6D37_13240 [Sphingobacteriales bacterium UTBCD1]